MAEWSPGRDDAHSGVRTPRVDLRRMSLCLWTVAVTFVDKKTDERAEAEREGGEKNRGGRELVVNVSQVYDPK